MVKTKKTKTSLILECVAVSIIYLAAYFIFPVDRVVSGIFLASSGVLLYVYFALVNQGNFLNFNAVFSAVWMTTIGLAQFQLLKYQVNWAGFTWLNLAVAHVVFIAANRVSAIAYPVLREFVKAKATRVFKKPLRIEVKKDRLFAIAMVVTLIGLASFAINVMIKGYVPFFAIGSSSSAYYDFYTRFQIFIVASLSSVGLSYYCIKNLELSKWKKRLLWTNILLLNFVLPILLVQRGTFLNSMLVFTAAVYLQDRFSLRKLIVCMTILVVTYFLGSYLRGFSTTQLAFLFQPKEIDRCEAVDGEIPAECVDPEDIPIESKDYVISPTVSFLYSYLTVSHDNFNSIVIHKDHDTYGIWQIKPFNVVLRNAYLEGKIEEVEKESVKHQVLPHLNSFNLISYAYYDFGLLGVILLMAIWSFSFGLIEHFHWEHRGIFSRISYGICLIPIALGFFLPWMSDFVPWLYWGTTLLMYIASTVPFSKASD